MDMKLEIRDDCRRRPKQHRRKLIDRALRRVDDSGSSDLLRLYNAELYLRA